MEINPIGYIRTDFKEKFGIPRQSGRTKLSGKIIMKKDYDLSAFMGIEGFSHIWLLFDFSKAHREEYNKTVRPPRLGGNRRVGVFASRSPFRENSIGLSCVRLVKIEKEGGQVAVYVSGVDLLDNTPIYDIKPYVPHADCIVDAIGGFSDDFKNYYLNVNADEEMLSVIPYDKRNVLLECLREDPRPAYHNDNREYVMNFSGFDVHFYVDNNMVNIIKIDLPKK